MCPSLPNELWRSISCRSHELSLIADREVQQQIIQYRCLSATHSIWLAGWCLHIGAVPYSPYAHL